LGSRVFDAIEAAGGVRGAVDLTPLNLARLLVDGEQVLVGVEGAPPLLGSPGATGGSPGDSLVDLNTATLEQLETLPGVGPVLGQRIIDWRTEHGRFSTVDELLEVSGIAEARFADLAPRVRV
jgi:competence protein ComEA